MFIFKCPFKMFSSFVDWETSQRIMCDSVCSKSLELDILGEEGHVTFRIKLFSIFRFKPKGAWKIPPLLLLLLRFPGLIVLGRPSAAQSEGLTMLSFA